MSKEMLKILKKDLKENEENLKNLKKDNIYYQGLKYSYDDNIRELKEKIEKLSGEKKEKDKEESEKE